ncbi:acyltransferase [Planctomycetales bacterium]|nr:acyltransferase [Planctomycetales bacterium]GHS96625.1 acyltransferase [Planctomycetales bacterium]GHT05122.1 acyltransferase [Planctomycetales bacterium]
MKYSIRYWLFKLLLFSTRVLPLRYGYWIALRIADFGYFIADRGRREALKRNLHVVFPDAGEQRLVYEARWIYRNWGKYLCEFFRFREFDENYFGKHVSIAHPERVAALFRRGKGVIMLSAHFGNWEIGAAYFSLYCGLPVNALVARQVSPQLEEMFINERAAQKIKLLYIDDDPRKIYQALKNNEMVCILGDRDPTGNGVPVNFFGRPCRFPQGPARLALATDCAVVMGVSRRLSNDNFILDLDTEVRLPTTGTRDEKVRQFTQNFADFLEEKIRCSPEQWSAFYDVWDAEWKQ